MTIRLYATLAFSTILLGCAASRANTPSNDLPVPVQISVPASDLALQLENDGKWLEAASEYNRLAEQTVPPAQLEYKVKAAQLYLKGNAIADAKGSLNAVASHAIPSELQLPFYLAHVKIALTERDGDAALRWLTKLSIADQSRLADEYIRMRIAAFEFAQNYLEASISRIEIEPLLKNPEEVDKNQQIILQNLATVTPEVLADVIKKHPSRTLRGWAELADLIAKNKDPFRVGNLIGSWRNRYQDHPITASVLTSLTPQKSDAPPPVEKIALLLPFDGPFHKAAVAVRDGFFSTFYATRIGDKHPTITVYDTGPGDENAATAYNKAIEEGATIVVGPLNKSGLEQIFKLSELQVPTIALNQLEDPSAYKQNLYQFGLSPEDEARQVAQRMWNDGHSSIAAFFPEGTWGERVLNAFKARWLEVGGKIVFAQSYAADKANMSDPVKVLLGIDKSEKRHKEISALLHDELKDNLKFEARRRHDIDAIFMAAFPRQARVIPPLMDFHSAGTLPLYSTSHAFTGTVDRQADNDLDHVVIGDMPWTLNDYNASPIKQSIVSLWPDDARQLSRLYALGVDAYQLLYYVNWLRANSNARFPGATGVLRIDANNRVLRELTWARFTKGLPKVIAVNPALSQSDAE